MRKGFRKSWVLFIAVISIVAGFFLGKSFTEIKNSIVFSPTPVVSTKNIQFSVYQIFEGISSNGWQHQFILMAITNLENTPILFPGDLNNHLTVTVETDTGDQYPAYFSYSNAKEIIFDRNIFLFPNITVTHFINGFDIVKNTSENQMFSLGIAFAIPDTQTVSKIFMNNEWIINMDSGADRDMRSPNDARNPKNVSPELPVTFSLSELGFLGPELSISKITNTNKNCDLSLGMIYKNVDVLKSQQIKVNLMLIDNYGTVYFPDFTYTPTNFIAKPQSTDNNVCFSLHPGISNERWLIIYNDTGQYKLVNLSLK